MMQLYWSPRSRAFAALWLMEEAGQPYERVLTDIGVHLAASIPIGETGVFLNSLDGSISHLDNLSQLVAEVSLPAPNPPWWWPWWQQGWDPVLPVKVVALFLIARGHALLGVLVLVTAKIAGTAILARLFTITQPTLMQLAWFAHWYPRWKAWKDRVMEEVRRSPMWEAARKFKASAAAQWAAFTRGEG